MKTAAERDRRRHPRFPQILELKAREAPALPSGSVPGPTVLGRVQNVSKGGMCLMSPQPVSRSAVLRCEIVVSDLAVGVPTLMQVRWTRKQNLKTESYLSGLQFLI